MRGRLFEPHDQDRSHGQRPDRGVGATGARWMNVIKEHLEQPYRLLLA